jgi:hypothetical protein|tara:strand:- start:806 stop:1105 length:300 start_codon:yes stop_codon:yes gene_type:complete
LAQASWVLEWLGRSRVGVLRIWRGCTALCLDPQAAYVSFAKTFNSRSYDTLPRCFVFDLFCISAVVEDEAVEKEDDGCGIDLPWAGGGPLRTASVDHFV